MKKIILITLIFMLTACSAGGSEFSRNQQKWTDAHITHYRFVLSIGCFCAFRSQMPLVVEVLNGNVVSMIGADGVVITSENSFYDTFAKYATIDRLFAELKADLSAADEVTVTYDSTYGFPTEINIDFIKNAADDELYLSASGFEKLL